MYFGCWRFLIDIISFGVIQFSDTRLLGCGGVEERICEGLLLFFCGFLFVNTDVEGVVILDITTSSS